MIKKFAEERGLSLMELIIAVSISMVLLGTVFLSFEIAYDKWKELNIRTELVKKASLTIQRMCKELREAVRQEGGGVVRSFTSQSIEFEADLNDDGDPELIEYTKSGENLLRTVDGQVSLMTRKVANFLVQTDSDDTPLIKEITLSLTLQKDGESYTLSSLVRPRMAGS